MRSGGIGHAVILGMFGALPVPAFAQNNPTFSGSSGIPPQIIPLYARGGPTGSIEGDGATLLLQAAAGIPAMQRVLPAIPAWAARPLERDGFRLKRIRRL